MANYWGRAEMQQTLLWGDSISTVATNPSVVRAVVPLLGCHMLILVRYEGGKLIYTHCRVIIPYTLGRGLYKPSGRVWHMRKSPHNRHFLDTMRTLCFERFFSICRFCRSVECPELSSGQMLSVGQVYILLSCATYIQSAAFAWRDKREGGGD